MRSCVSLFWQGQYLARLLPVLDQAWMRVGHASAKKKHLMRVPLMLACMYSYKHDRESRMTLSTRRLSNECVVLEPCASICCPSIVLSFRPPFVHLSSTFRPPFVHLSSTFRPPFVHLSSTFRPPFVPFVHLSSTFRPARKISQLQAQKQPRCVRFTLDLSPLWLSCHWGCRRAVLTCSPKYS
jgi:hypothetical protein